MLGDIDHFKQINDAYGHLAGNKALRLVIKALRETDFIARYGGEEFAIILPSTSGNEAMLAAEKLRQAVAKCPFHRGEEEISVTISFGISETKTGDTIEMLFERTDKAL